MSNSLGEDVEAQQRFQGELASVFGRIREFTVRETTRLRLKRRNCTSLDLECARTHL